MIQIEPVTFPLGQGIATQMSVLILPHTTDALNCSTYYELKTDEGKVLQKGNYDLTDEQYADWGSANTWVDQCVAEAIGVTIINPTI